MGPLATQVAIPNLAIMVGSADRRCSYCSGRRGHDLLEALGLAGDTVAIRDCRPRLAAVDRTAVEMAHDRLADCAQCARTEAACRIASPPFDAISKTRYRRSAAARNSTHRRPLRTAFEAARGAQIIGLRWRSRAGRSRR